MPDFSNGVATPGGASYMAPLLSFQQFANWAPDDPYQKTFNDQQQQLNQQRIAQGQRQAQLAQAFPNGLPTDPRTGAINYGSVAATLAKFGDVGDAINVMQQQQPPLSPMFGGSGGSGGQPTPTMSPASTDTTTAKIIQAESGGNPDAKNPNSSAAGLGGFTDSTWLESIKKYFPNLAQGRSDDQLLAMRRIPKLASRVTQAFTADHEAGLAKAGLPVTPATTYLAHFAGLGGAIKVLHADPNTPVSQLLGNAAIKANPFLKGMTASDLETWAAHKMQGPAMVAQNAQPPQRGRGDAASPGVRVADAGGSPVSFPSASFADRFAAAVPGGGSGLPPSANAGTPAPQIAPAQPSNFRDRFAAAGQPQAAPAAQPQPQPVQPQAQPQQPQQPLVPQVPLPKGFTDPQQAIQALRNEAVKYYVDPRRGAAEQAQALDAWASRIEQSIKPIAVNSMTTLVDPRTGRPVFQGAGAAAIAAAGAGGASLDADAQRYRQTGTLPPNMGRGAQGAAEAQAIRARAAELEINEGGDPAKWPERWQDYRAAGVGKSAGERVKATREENLNLILKAADAAIPAALEASKALPRSDFVPWNKLIQNGQIKSSNPRLVEFGMANLQLAEHWARAMNPTGVMRESDRDKALSFLDTAYGNNTYERAVMQLQKQITRERDAVRGGGTSLPSKGSVDPGGEDKDGWVAAPNGALIREKK